MVRGPMPRRPSFVKSPDDLDSSVRGILPMSTMSDAQTILAAPGASRHRQIIDWMKKRCREILCTCALASPLVALPLLDAENSVGMMVNIVLPIAGSFAFLLLVAGAWHYAGRCAVANPDCARRPHTLMTLCFNATCLRRSVRRLLGLNAGEKNLSPEEKERETVAELRALPCHIVSDGDPELAEATECALCLSTVAAGDSLRTLPCAQCALRCASAHAHAAHAAQVLCASVRKCAQVCGPAKRRATATQLSDRVTAGGRSAFHQQCVDRWLIDSQRHLKRECPLCKKNPLADAPEAACASSTSEDNAAVDGGAGVENVVEMVQVQIEQ